MKTPLSLLLFAICLTLTSGVGAELAAEDEEAPEPSQHDRVYFFEHRLLPRWTHESDGAFFADLSAGSIEQLRIAAADIAGTEFSREVTVDAIAGGGAVLISFAKPAEPPECFFAAVTRSGEVYRYFTLEMTEDLFGDGTVAVLGEWEADGAHVNMGGRNYSSKEEFTKEIVAILGNAGADLTPAARMTPGEPAPAPSPDATAEP